VDDVFKMYKFFLTKLRSLFRRYKCGGDFFMIKKYVSCLVAGFLVFGVPAMALACNWGAKAEGDCNQVSVTVSIDRGKEEAAGSYDLYWSKDGNAKKGQIIDHGDIPALKTGETHKVVYKLDQNKNGREGNFIFRLKEPRGSIWSNQVTVSGCGQQQPEQPQQPGQPPAKGGKLPKTATSYPLGIAWSGAFLVIGFGLLAFRKRQA
jgi:LPXTG-motif cell wall-anchored protein